MGVGIIIQISAKDNGMENICAFVKADNVCKKPPRSWTKQYEKLSKKDSS